MPRGAHRGNSAWNGRAKKKRLDGSSPDSNRGNLAPEASGVAADPLDHPLWYRLSARIWYSTFDAMPEAPARGVFKWVHARVCRSVVRDGPTSVSATAMASATPTRPCCPAPSTSPPVQPPAGAGLVAQLSSTARQPLRQCQLNSSANDGQEVVLSGRLPSPARRGRYVELSCLT